MWCLDCGMEYWQSPESIIDGAFFHVECVMGVKLSD